MLVGAILPSFDKSAERSVERAHEAETCGLHGVFAYDHLWPMGAPRKPAIAPFPLLARVAIETSQLTVGTLVARIGLVSDEVLVGEFRTLSAVSGGRLIAGIGTGDKKSADENYAFGVGYTTPDERQSSLRQVAEMLHAAGIEVWIGAGSERTNSVAWETGVTLNVYDVDTSVLKERRAKGTVSWGGPLPHRPAAAAARLRDLAAAGATWAVFGAPVERIVAAAEAAEISLGWRKVH